MPLSEHEQRLLDEMEKALSAEDPRLASTLGSPTLPRLGGRFTGIFALLSVIGLGLIVAGVAQQIPLLGIVADTRQNLLCGLCFSFISIARSYCIRRIFNGIKS